MSLLTVYSENAPLTPEFCSNDGTRITHALREVGVRFERWDASRQLSAQDDDEAVLEAYASDIERLMQAGGYRSVDVLRCLPDNPNRGECRAKFLNEHTHPGEEVRSFS